METNFTRLSALNEYADEHCFMLIHLALILPNAERAPLTHYGNTGIGELGNWLQIRPKRKPRRIANHVLQGYSFNYLADIRMHLRVDASHMNLLYFLYQLHWMDFNITN